MSKSATETGKDGQPVVPFAEAAEFEAWLAKNFADCEKGIWIKFAKKGSGIPSVTYAEALDAALCYGWIDAHVRPWDDSYWVHKFIPRRVRSKWSQKNREHVARLIKSKRMKPAGLKEVKAAKADGRWEEAYASASKITVPDDLQAELDRHPDAKAFFETLKGANRYAILYRLHDAKRPETRAKRLAKYIEMLKAGETLH